MRFKDIFSYWLLSIRWPLGSIALVCAPFYVALGLYLTAVVVRSSSWPSTVGTITSSRVVAATFGKNTSYRPEVRYRYSVNGTMYENNRVGLLGPGVLGSEVQRVVARYPTGSSVRVFYPPSSPARSALVTGFTRSQLWVAAASFVFIVVGLLVFPGWKLLRRPNLAA